MPFNADTYRANKYRREARQALADARAAAQAGDSERAASRVRLARLQWRIYLSARRLRRMG